MSTPMSRKDFFRLAGASAGAVALDGLVGTPAAAATTPSASRDSGATGVEFAAYYFPQWHADPRNEQWFGRGWTEWEVLKSARPRFAGHEQPKRPLWGYTDESDPKQMARRIDAASSHGLSAFVFDWYWYDGPFLNGALDRGFLKADNRDDLKFALMWANHDWWDLYPAKRRTLYDTLMPGAVDRAMFERATDHIITNYLRHPRYWRVGGKPYFSIYDIGMLQTGLGGRAATRAALDDFRARARRAGAGDLHLNVVVNQWMTDVNAMVAELGFDTVTHYTWIHHEYDLLTQIATPYDTVRESAAHSWDRFDRDFEAPYIPVVSMGWDPSPRTAQSEVYENIGYPFTPVFTRNTPGEFQRALHSARDFVSRPDHELKIVTINAWNEWTEGSYLEPDVEHGMAYLDALRSVARSSGGRR
jgi:hypothetical protein